VEKKRQEFLKIVKCIDSNPAAINEWNSYRKLNPDHIPFLPKLQFIATKFLGANFKDAYLQGGLFQGVDMRLSTFRRANLREINFQGSMLDLVNFQKANLENSDLQECILNGTKFQKALLRGANLKNSSLNGSNFNEADLREVELEGASFENATLCKTNLTKVNLKKINLRGTNLSEANLSGTNLREANLSHAKLNGTDLSDTKLLFANLNHVNLYGANITGTNLYGTIREGWAIDNIKCDFFYFDPDGKERIPNNRDFEPGEFEERYKELPKIEYYFKDGLTPIDMIVMDRVVQGIQAKHPKFDLKLKSFNASGIPHAVFTIENNENRDEALKEITQKYETQITVLNAEKTILNEKLNKFMSETIRQTGMQITYEDRVVNSNPTIGNENKNIFRKDIKNNPNESRFSMVFWGVVASLIATAIISILLIPEVRDWIKTSLSVLIQ